jgi:isoleucyl-tRNA synthetase
MSKDSDQTGADYRATLFLPQTDFPMKAGLPQAEPKWLAKWEADDLYGQIRAAAKGRPLFILHDGPPYANGEIHSGTGLNKILKDFVIRSQTMMGKDAPYVPGWDCHGLPIEWKIEEKYRAAGKSKDSVPIDQLRKDCREFALKWIDVQRAQFKRMGVMAEWSHPYTTMNFAAEATIAGELHKFVDAGLLYRGFRPVMWSPVEKTALAEAEIEYHEKTSPTIYVKFPVVSFDQSLDKEQVDFAAGFHGDEKLSDEENARKYSLRGASVVIWTTTPWTIPGNRAICYAASADVLQYALYQVESVSDGSLAVPGDKLILATVLEKKVEEHAKLTLKHLRGVESEELSGLTCAHPFRELDPYYGFDVPLLAGEHVTADTGTGFVHTAPGHGEDDFDIVLEKLGKDYPNQHPDAFAVITADGAFAPNVPVFAGKYILSRDGKKEGDANGAVIKQLIESGKLLAKGSLRHQYPHSWRSKAPVIFRATPQWFAAMDKPFRDGKTLRQLAVEGIAATKWYPAAGSNRIGSMVEGRPDWVLSRQRAWGVPLAIFVDKTTGQVLNDPAVNARIVEAFKAEGADAWFNSPASRFLGDLPAENYEQVKDILDVWFDSGSTHVFTVEQPVDPVWPQADQADLYLEGSDQHRGWFQSSLLEGCATKGHAPYKAVLTHGFVLDEKGYKMSKSIGNTVLPQTIADQNGADILRLWAASSDFTEDLRIGGEIIKANVDAYRRLRNTIRFMLANLAGFSEEERIDASEMPELERYILAKVAELDALVKKGYAEYDFNRVFNSVFSFCTNELSAFYFDIRKDALYCDTSSSVRRRAARTVTDELFRRVVTWLAPILAFTMEEAWTTRYGEGSVHLQLFAETPAAWADAALIEKWNRVRTLRRVLTGALEIARRDKVIGASLEADPVLFVSDPADAALLQDLDLAEIAITSGAHVETAEPPADAFRLPDVAGVAAAFRHAQGDKCARCWRVLPEVGKVPEHPDLCHRCSDAVG